MAVLVVGAGPVGLTLACELRRHGVACLIVDEGEGPTPPQESRALGIHARTLEVFEDLGVVGPVVEQGRVLRAVNAYEGGRRFARFEPDFGPLRTPYPYVLSLSQGATERILIDRLAEQGGSVAWRTRLTGLGQDDQGVTATLAVAGGGTQEVRASWLIGCDGAHSTVRHQLGLPFEGVAYEETFLLADVDLDWDANPHEAHVLLTRDGLIPTIPLPEPGRWRLIDPTSAGEVDDPRAILARFQELLTEAGCTATLRDEVVWASAFRIHRRAVDRLRVGRCFLAGDAAHIHSPVGAQGMNTGIQDAYNLAWKLALVAAGAASETLLDSYGPERLPIAEAVQRGTDRATRLVTLRNPLAKALRKKLAAWLSGLRPVRRWLAREISQLGVHYRGSPIVAEHWEVRRASAGLKPGDRVPDLELEPGPTADGPRRLFDVLRDPHHVLLLFAGGPDQTTAEEHRELAALGALARQGRWAEHLVPYLLIRPETDEAPRAAAVPAVPRIIDADGRLHRQFDARSVAVSLIRPDGYVGYRSQPATASQLAAYLHKLFV